ncbi:hypothetical protein [Microvirga antarctica]|uniref:hypothetical protein n=1 Tax=Microvirga antarctica TaxID=2819233 RepID=UPI001B31070B|nr:hypothetical protein [Microvirga antarctica]
MSKRNTGTDREGASRPGRLDFANVVNRSLTVSVNERVYDELTSMAKKAGMSATAYAQALFLAAYSARCGVKDDPDLSDAVAGTLILHGAGLDSTAIAKTLGIAERDAVRIVTTWRDSRAKVAA